MMNDPKTIDPDVLYYAVLGVIAEASRDTPQGYIPSWEINRLLNIDTGIDARIGSIGDRIKRTLIENRLIEEVPDLGCRYRLTRTGER